MAASKKQPKRTCCTSRPRCKRCPLKMLAEGTLPEGYTVKKRKLVKDKKAAKAARKRRRLGSLPDAA